MPRCPAEADKAIRLAWERERELVSKGVGTRDWTPEQQQDILEYGKAFDDDGKAFEGQHMKSAAQYPEYQGNPDNIQFLTRKEHLEAHNGSWLNPSNWYYDPIEKQFFDFGDGEPIPCTVIKLSNPVVLVEKCNTNEVADEATQAEEQPSSGTDPPTKVSKQAIESDTSVYNPKTGPDTNAVLQKRAIDGINNIANTVKEFSDKHPVATALVKLGVGAVGVYFTSKAVGSVSKPKHSEPTDQSALLSQAIDSLGEMVTKAVSNFDIKNSESFLKQLGYSVAKNASLSDAERQNLLRETITNGKMLKEAVCAYLEFNINLHKNQERFAEAVGRWISDLEFVKTNL